MWEWWTPHAPWLWNVIESFSNQRTYRLDRLVWRSFCSIAILMTHNCDDFQTNTLPCSSFRHHLTCISVSRVVFAHVSIATMATVYHLNAMQLIFLAFDFVLRFHLEMHFFFFRFLNNIRFPFIADALITYASIRQPHRTFEQQTPHSASQLAYQHWLVYICAHIILSDMYVPSAIYKSFIFIIGLGKNVLRMLEWRRCVVVYTYGWRAARGCKCTWMV